MLQTEGCLNEVLFNNPKWDDMDGHDVSDYDIRELVSIIPDDVIYRQWEGECFDE